MSMLVGLSHVSAENNSKDFSLELLYMSFHDMMLKGLGVEKHGNANELMKKPPKERTVPKIHDFEPNATHQMDLVYLTHDQVKKTKYRYALSVMDTATRLGDAEPLADRAPEDVIAALKKIYKRGPLKKPSVRITTDNGSEFKGAFNTWVEDQGLIHKTARTGNSRQVALAEYLNYIIGRYVALYQHSKEEETGVTNREWVSKLPTIISNYNKWVKSKQQPEGKKPIKPEEERKEKMKSLGPVRCKGQSCKLLEVGTKVRAIRIKPKDDVTGKRLHGGFRAGDKRWESTIRTVERSFLKPVSRHCTNSQVSTTPPSLVNVYRWWEKRTLKPMRTRRSGSLKRSSSEQQRRVKYSTRSNGKDGGRNTIRRNLVRSWRRTYRTWLRTTKTSTHSQRPRKQRFTSNPNRWLPRMCCKH